jgi:hypothetical protein
VAQYCLSPDQVYTSDSSDASFDGEVSLTLKGESGQTSYKALLAQGGPGVFEVSPD